MSRFRCDKSFFSTVHTNFRAKPVSIMEECIYCLHPLLSDEDFGSIRNHSRNCPAQRKPSLVDVEAYDRGYMDRLRNQRNENEIPAYELGWQQANEYCSRLQLEKKFKPR